MDPSAVKLHEADSYVMPDEVSALVCDQVHYLVIQPNGSGGSVMGTVNEIY